jgi:hypothetical protein
MTMIKKGTCRSSVSVSSKVYVCDGCGYTKMAASESGMDKECPKCHSKMSMISSGSEENASSDNAPDIV